MAYRKPAMTKDASSATSGCSHCCKNRARLTSSAGRPSTPLFSSVDRTRQTISRCSLREFLSRQNPDTTPTECGYFGRMLGSGHKSGVGAKTMFYKAVAVMGFGSVVGTFQHGM